MAGVGTKDIKRKIKSVNSTKQITKAMELVSTAKLKRNKDKLEKTKPYFDSFMGTVQSIIKNEKNLKHEYLEERVVKKTLYIVIGADRGLCGGYNINVVKKLLEDMEKDYKSVFISVGKKMTDYIERNNWALHSKHLGISENPTYKDALDISKEALKMFKMEQVDEIRLIYTKLMSTISQVPEIIQLLPVEKMDIQDDQPYEYVNYEPSAEAVIGHLVPKYIESTIYGALVESSAAEQAARRIAMENATDNADEMLENLTLSYNQARQAAITQEISEIVSGAEALK